MAEILPFPGLFFDSERFKEPGEFIAPPYDVIKDKKSFLSLPYNITRITLSWDTEDYSRRGELFRSWIKEGILKPDTTPAFYLHYHYFTLGNEERVRKGIFALVRLYPFEERMILPHEETLPAPKEDRLKLLRELRTSLEPVFFLFPGGRNLWKELTGGERIFDFTLDGERHLLFAIRREDVQERIMNYLKKKKLYIADGHHRYETSLIYQKENPSFTHILGYLTSMEEEGLVILPAHRLIKKLERGAVERLLREGEKFFHILPWKGEDFVSVLREKGRRHHAFLFYYHGSQPLLLVSRNEKKVEEEIPDHSPAWKRLDISILHSVIMEEIMGVREEELQREGLLSYIVDKEEAWRRVEKGEFAAGFFLNPTSVEEVKRVADRGEKMPGKATYFYPKVPSGLVMVKP